MTTVELTSRDEVEGCHQQARPTSPGHGVKQHIHPSKRQGTPCEEITHPVHPRGHVAVVTWLGQELTEYQVFGEQVEHRVSFDLQALSRWQLSGGRVYLRKG